MIQYNDGSFSSIMEFGKINEIVTEMVSVRQYPKAIHFGSVYELKKVKQQKDIAEEITELKNRITELESHYSIIKKPTKAEMAQYTKQKQFGGNDITMIVR
ncbi:MAG: hypothetical protein PVH88_02030 [Ignavibacteria bacterium]